MARSKVVGLIESLGTTHNTQTHTARRGREGVIGVKATIKN
jgi:hypothetical protein